MAVNSRPTRLTYTASGDWVLPGRIQRALTVLRLGEKMHGSRTIHDAQDTISRARFVVVGPQWPEWLPPQEQTQGLFLRPQGWFNRERIISEALSVGVDAIIQTHDKDNPSE